MPFSYKTSISKVYILRIRNESGVPFTFFFQIRFCRNLYRVGYTKLIENNISVFSAGMIRLLANYVHVKPLAVGPQDILFDACSHLVKKFILHTNFPGHYNFNM